MDNHDVDIDAMFQCVNSQSIRAVFDSDAEMARAFGIDRSNMTRWKSGMSVRLKETRLLQEFCIVVSLLIDFLAPTTIPKWLRGTNVHLKNSRPIDVLLSGRLSEVIVAIERERSGTFA